MNENIKEYLYEYRELIKKRCEIDARIDFMSELIRSTYYDKADTFKIEFYDKNGDLVCVGGNH